jgi:exonuclease VII large subunit
MLDESKQSLANMKAQLDESKQKFASMKGRFDESKQNLAGMKGQLDEFNHKLDKEMATNSDLSAKNQTLEEELIKATDGLSEERASINILMGNKLFWDQFAEFSKMVGKMDKTNQKIEIFRPEETSIRQYFKDSYGAVKDTVKNHVTGAPVELSDPEETSP